MTKTTVFIFHPSLEKSQTNAVLATGAKQAKGVCVRHIDSLYPDGKIDVSIEQNILENTDHIVLQFPFYWYSGPALMKKWLDDVLAYGWAYGGEGTPLAGKKISLVVTLGGSKDDYQPDGKAGHTVEAFLLPWITTARYVRMQYRETIVIDGTIGKEVLVQEVQRYQRFLESM